MDVIRPTKEDKTTYELNIATVVHWTLLAPCEQADNHAYARAGIQLPDD